MGASQVETNSKRAGYFRAVGDLAFLAEETSNETKENAPRRAQTTIFCWHENGARRRSLRGPIASGVAYGASRSTNQKRGLRHHSKLLVKANGGRFSFPSLCDSEKRSPATPSFPLPCPFPAPHFRLKPHSFGFSRADVE